MTNTSSPIVALGSDHAGFEMKDVLKAHLEAQGIETIDLGTNSSESVDYPDFGEAMAVALSDGPATVGVLVCGTGIGISIAANRYDHVRAALAHDHLGAQLSREHNDANVIALGARTTGIETAKDCVDVFLKTEFGGDRHVRRVKKLSPDY